MKKSIMSFLLAVTMIFGAFDLTVFASDNFTKVDETGHKSTAYESIIYSAETGESKDEAHEVSKMEGGETVSGSDIPVVTSVILSVHDGALRIRAWSDSTGIKEANAAITCNLPDGDIYRINQSLEITEGYYTSHLYVDSGVKRIRVLVGVTDEQGRTGYKAAVVYPENLTAEQEKVSNDLWIRFLDGEGTEGSEYTYTGKAIKPKVEIYEGATLLQDKKDYTISYKNNKNVGMGTIIVKGKGNYRKKTESKFIIRPKSISDNDITIDDFSAVNNGKRQEKVPKITYNKKRLSNKNNKDFSITYEDTSQGAYQEPGIYYVKIKGNGNYTGETVVEFSVGPRLTRNLKVSKINPVEYTGQAVSINNLEIKDGKNIVPLNNFTLSYSNNIDAGTAVLKIKGDGINYAGTKTVTFPIVGTPIADVIDNNSSLPKSVVYNGEEQTLLQELSYQNKPLIEGEDYRIDYSNNLNVGKASMTISGKGRFTGSVKHTFKILPLDASDNEGKALTIHLDGEDEQGNLALPFAKGGVKPAAQVRFKGRLLTSGKDYTLQYRGNKSVTTGQTTQKPVVIVKFKGNFSKTLEKTFTIHQQKLSNTIVTVQDIVPGKKKFSWKSKVVIKDLDGKKLTPGKDYDKNIGYYLEEACINEAKEESYLVGTTLWVKIKGIENYADSEAVVSYQVKAATIAKARVKIKTQDYTGRRVILDNTAIDSVRVGKEYLIPGEDFVILQDSYINNIKKGTARVTLKGINEYGGTITASFKIVQKDFRWRGKLEDNQQSLLYEVSMNDCQKDEYVEKNGVVRITAEIFTQPEGVPTALKVNGEYYSLNKLENHLYEVKIPAGNTAGKLPIEVTAIRIGTEEHNVNVRTDIGVLKDIPKVENISWIEEEYGKLGFGFVIKDEDRALLEGSHILITKEGKTIYTDTIKTGENKITFETEPESEYKASIYFNYDRDEEQKNGKNEVIDKEIFTSLKSVKGEFLELKEITSVRLYYQGQEIEQPDISLADLEDTKDYVAKIESETAKDLYVKVNDFVKEGNKLRVIPELTGFMHYQPGKEEIEKDKNILLYVDNATGSDESGLPSAQTLLNEMNNNRGGSFTLTEDLDASGITTGFGVTGNFTGTLDGAGYTIYNLNTTLFERLNGGCVKNLNITDANISGKRAVIAQEIENNGLVENCNLLNPIINSPQVSMVGGVVGQLKSGAVTNCRIENISLTANNTAGGVAGQTDASATVENVMVSGQLAGIYQNYLGSRIAGISGWHTGTIKKCYTQILLQTPGVAGNGGLIGGPGDGGTAGRIEDSLAFVKGSGNGIGGFSSCLKNVDNLYQLTGQGTGENTAEGITTVEELTKELVVETVGLSEDVWKFIEDSQTQIPHFKVLSRMEEYREDKKTAYYNLSKLAYAQNTEELLEAANLLNDPDLIQKRIRQIYPLNNKGEYIAAMTAEDVMDLTKILVEFTDGTSKEILVKYSFTADGLIAVYHSEELGISYHYHKYISRVDESFKNELLNMAEAYNYDDDLDPLTAMEDRRQYRDYYIDETSKNLEEFIVMELISREDYPFYVEDESLRTVLKERLAGELPRLVYGYNYFNKWYDFEIGSINPAELLYFDSEVFSKELTREFLVDSVIEGDRTDTHQTAAFFQKYIQPKAELDLYNALERFITLAGYEDPNEWFKDTFNGILKEQNVLGVDETGDITYRIWDNMEKLGMNRSILLPVLTAPQEDMILVSGPTQLFLSSINRYKESNTEQSRKEMEAVLDTYCQWLGNYYGSIVNLVPEAKERMKNILCINFDTRLDYQSIKYPGLQEPTVTEEPVFKWVNESLQKWCATNGAGAYANGTDTFYVHYPTFWSEGEFSTFSHENAHNQDGRLFYQGFGRRKGSGAEDHAGGLLEQEFGNGTMTFNLTRDYAYTADIVVNSTVERINTPEKLHDYYRDMFDAGYVLDYMISKAFLKLSPLEQSKLAVKAVETYSEDGISMTLQYVKVSEEEIIAMDLKTIGDLIENKLALRNTEGQITNNSYYVDIFWNVQWYQPHNPTGASDGSSFKRLSHEMLGVGGYENGLMTWASGKSENDLDALRTITNNPENTFNQYKNTRFNEVENKLDLLTDLNVSLIATQFEEALREDSQAGNLSNTRSLKKIYYQTLKLATQDFTNGNVYDPVTATEVSSAQELIEVLSSGEPAYIKLTDHIDFTDVEQQGDYYIKNFSGIFDGNGYKISGQKGAIFETVTFASFRNMEFDISEITSGQEKAILSLNSKNMIINGITYDEEKGLPLVLRKHNTIYKEYNISGINE